MLVNTICLLITVLSSVSSGSVVDGSGAVTGLAFHQLQQEFKIMAAEKEEQRYKAVTVSKKLDTGR